MGPPVAAVPSAGAMDLLGEGLDSLVSYLSILSLCIDCSSLSTVVIKNAIIIILTII